MSRLKFHLLVCQGRSDDAGRGGFVFSVVVLPSRGS